MSDRRERRYVILAEGKFGTPASKTAMGVITYSSDPTSAVLDSTNAGRNVAEWLPGHDVPIVATLDEALPYGPTALLMGIAPAGGKIPQPWRDVILASIDHGLDIVSGLHELVTEDGEFVAAARSRGVALVDHRRPPERREVASGRPHRDDARVLLTVGTDCAVGKMTVALELRSAAEQAGLTTAFVPTGQTGIMIAGWGASVDGVASDFLQGTAEHLVERAEEMGDWVFVEGQGSIDHPAYSSVTLGLIHGATPDAMILVHQVGRLERHGWEGKPDSALKPLAENVRLYEAVASAVRPAPVIAIALNTSLLDEDEARAEIAAATDATGLPVDDPFRFGPEPLFAAIHQRLEGDGA